MLSEIAVYADIQQLTRRRRELMLLPYDVESSIVGCSFLVSIL